MKPFVFKLKHALRQRIDLGPLIPDALTGLSLEQIDAIPLWVARERMPVGELFELEAGDIRSLHIIANGARLDCLGACMTQGQITLEGDAGDYLAQGMRGGDVSVRGSCGAFAANGMRGGTLMIDGNAGDFLGAAQSGEAHGLKGGLVLVKGDAGDRAGDHQRRGTILIEGNVGDYCGARMHAGTIAVLGDTGKGTGFGMHRGTILLSRKPSVTPTTFFDAGACDLTFLTLLIAGWKRLDSRFSGLDHLRKRVRRFVGDQACGGKGEILIWVGDPLGVPHDPGPACTLSDRAQFGA